MRKILITCVLLLATLLTWAQASSFEAKRGVIPGGYNFWIHTPDDYEPGGHRFPLIIFLHGASLCGNNLDRVLRYGTMDAIEKGKRIPMLVVAPQNPGGAWNPKKLNDLLTWMEDHYSVDTTRVYVLGMSLGGYGTMDFVAAYPHKIAAAMALCGGSSRRDVQSLGQVPLWIMHGTADKAVSVKESKRVVEALQQQGHDQLLRYDWFGGASHGYLARVFYLQKTYDWLIAHSLHDRPREVSTIFDITKDDIASTYRELKIDASLYEKD